MSPDSIKTAEIVLRTKLHRPATPLDLVPRPTLLERLEAGRSRPLTLVSAPAGYGKSILIGSWLTSSDWPSAWVSLDSDDSDLRQFLTYFVAAIGTVFPDACRASMSLTKAAELPPVARLATILINELDALEQPFILVLDDYHRIEPTSLVNELVKGLLTRPPIPLHLAILSRRDPPLPLVALRARGQLTELRMADLRFSRREAQALLANTADIAVDDDTLARLEEVVEGWVVGLRLVSLAWRPGEDREQLLEQLQAGVWQTQEYLIQEVVDRQPPRLRDWLLQSAILDRFCGPLCEAVCAAPDVIEADFDGLGFIQDILQGNLFAIALDAKSQWCRYHHLFQEMLQHELVRRLAPAQITALHARASAWFEHEGLIEEAIRHALAAGDVPGGVRIIEQHRQAELDKDRWYVVERWLDALPVIDQPRPNLLLAEAWARYERFQIWQLPAILDRVAVLLDAHADDPALWGELYFFRGAVAYWEGDGERCLAYMAKARRLLPGQRKLVWGLLELYLGIGRCMTGERGLAVEALEQRVHDAMQSEGLYLSRLLAGLFFVHLVSGDLRQARAQAQRLQTVAKNSAIDYTEVWSHYMQASTYLHAHDLEQALQFFSMAARLRYKLHVRGAVDALAGLALTRQLLQRDADAAQTLGQLDDFTRELDAPEFKIVAASCRARIALQRGDLDAAAQWAWSVGFEPVSAELFMWLEVPALTQARVMVAEGSTAGLAKATEVLSAIRRLSEACRYINQSIEVGVLESLALAKLGHADAALSSLATTVAIAVKGGWTRPFVELGEPMAAMLGRLAVSEQGLADHVRGILHSFPRNSTPHRGALADQAQGPPRGGDRLEEPLTNREIDVLELLAQRLQNKEIAARLFVSPETVKAHLKHLYQKLGVNNRREAAARGAKILPGLPGTSGSD